MISQNAFHLKGTGWYVTDYANKSKSPSSTETKKKEASAKSPKKSEKSTDKSS